VSATTSPTSLRRPTSRSHDAQTPRRGRISAVRPPGRCAPQASGHLLSSQPGSRHLTSDRWPQAAGTVDVDVTDPGGFEIRVQVRPSADDAWLTAGSVPAERDRGRGLRLVVDQGERWLIRFPHSGVHGGTIECSGDVVQSDGVDVSAEVEVELRAVGLGPAARGDDSRPHKRLGSSAAGPAVAEGGGRTRLRPLRDAAPSEATGAQAGEPMTSAQSMAVTPSCRAVRERERCSLLGASPSEPERIEGRMTRRRKPSGRINGSTRPL